MIEAAPSPFIPGTHIQFAWDSTSLGYFKRCPRLYEYSIIRGLRSSGADIHLFFGGLYHKALENYDHLLTQGTSSEDALVKVVRELFISTWIDGKPWESGDTAKNRENLIRSVIWYITQFGESDPAKTIVLKDGKPAVELSFKMPLDWKIDDQHYILAGHLDRVVTFGGETFVMDRKTTGTTIGTYYFERYDLDNQMSLYSLAAKAVFDSPVRGVLIDAAQIAVGFTRFGRGVTYRTDEQLGEWLADLKVWLDKAREYAEAKYWPQNDAACFGCRFVKVCSKSPLTRDIELNQFEVRHWNPLENR